jgi:His/Glu/Gln/Arg/opine family amino acid ABC transporter permease subunit
MAERLQRRVLIMEIVALIQKYGPSLVKGTIVTLELTVTSMVLSILLGLLGAFGRLSNSRPAYALTTAYVEVIRGAPLILQLFFVYFSLTQVGLVLSGFWAATIALGVFGGAFLTEIFRAGIQAVERGQVEAAYSLGMSHNQAMRKIILPQAVRLVLPPLANHAIQTLKNTSIVVVIAVGDLMYQAYSAASVTFRSIEFYTMAGIIYLAFCYPMSRVLAIFEDRWNVDTSHRH